jgi:CheY-like chemotaxis protein
LFEEDTAPREGLRRILIVDDDPDMLNLLEAVLGRAGFVTVGADNGLEALAILQKDARFDILCADLRMPRLDGIRLIDQVRRGYPHIKVIVISAWCDDRVRAKVAEYGVRALVAKPFQRDHLLAVLAKLS